MSLYDRDYSKSREFENTRTSDLGIFIKQTYQLFAASLLAATVGAYVGIFALASFFIESLATFWILFFVEIGLLFALMYKKKEAPLNLILLFAFTFCSGLTLTPLLISVLALPAGGIIIAQAFALTTVAFAGLSIFAMNTKKDFTMMGKALFIVFLVVFAASLINIFLHSSIFSLVISSVSAILFSFYILYDTQNIIRGNYETPIEGAVALYLDFVNLFINLLNILRSLNR
ncbi:Bax inhibitor-1/YccA family protein [Campylobacter sp. LH-2024]|uniref:Bax inhibitor-1/YccA family protein n=1 Tax=Campylobacter molothri TaxID=1032242 RepID=A0ACC5W280_9BACT|nr:MULTISPECIES: Bax inhibitor-1/YccA family protein [unclassified Campylobacter]MBZ7929007.1 Bax inhibitor-1/YccA family protein [Campylobacter sp. RM10542]MBZ7930393.1 Bax inhibitor-1/YccA family protein [Campylobacter sp. W0067]MBZ7931888.1 Bax inhibitor-1/YccA family protein [Campylobacter sp. RM12910]MBZ7934849.1 Bax inhibitor-1/YccA family protein [Campylobacter sp. W0065]MBZ7937935.1 Bax inhibitor-1/YccA family protein [Campylobacter sp. RM10538]MBZ7941109.1 Bax inhibitor-1/YccA family